MDIFSQSLEIYLLQMITSVKDFLFTSLRMILSRSNRYNIYPEKNEKKEITQYVLSIIHECCRNMTTPELSINNELQLKELLEDVKNPFLSRVLKKELLKQLRIDLTTFIIVNDFANAMKEFLRHKTRSLNVLALAELHFGYTIGHHITSDQSLILFNTMSFLSLMYDSYNLELEETFFVIVSDNYVSNAEALNREPLSTVMVKRSGTYLLRYFWSLQRCIYDVAENPAAGDLCTALKTRQHKLGIYLSNLPDFETQVPSDHYREWVYICVMPNMQFTYIIPYCYSVLAEKFRVPNEEPLTVNTSAVN